MHNLLHRIGGVPKVIRAFPKACGTELSHSPNGPQSRAKSAGPGAGSGMFPMQAGPGGKASPGTLR